MVHLLVGFVSSSSCCHHSILGPGQCDNGLIMWLPVLGTVTPDTNGLMVAKQSHVHHLHYIRNGSWDQNQGSLSGHVEFLRFWRQLGDTCDTWSPTLQLGDVLVMNKVIKNITASPISPYCLIFSVVFTLPLVLTLELNPDKLGNWDLSQIASQKRRQYFNNTQVFKTWIDLSISCHV